MVTISIKLCIMVQQVVKISPCPRASISLSTAFMAMIIPIIDGNNQKDVKPGQRRTDDLELVAAKCNSNRRALSEREEKVHTCMTPFEGGNGSQGRPFYPHIQAENKNRIKNNVDTAPRTSASLRLQIPGRR